MNHGMTSSGERYFSPRNRLDRCDFAALSDGTFFVINTSFAAPRFSGGLGNFSTTSQTQSTPLIGGSTWGKLTLDPMPSSHDLVAPPCPMETNQPRGARKKNNVSRGLIGVVTVESVLMNVMIWGNRRQWWGLFPSDWI